MIFVQTMIFEFISSLYRAARAEVEFRCYAVALVCLAMTISIRFLQMVI